MNTNELDRRRALLSPTGGLLLAAGVQAQPTTLQVIVGFPPGGPNDIAARAIQQRLAAVLGVNVVIENKAGASGELAARLVAKGPADGSTMLLGSGGALAISPLINAALPYDPAKELLAVHSVAVSPQIVLVGANSPYKSVAELVEAARRSPGRISYASAGGSSPTRLAAALIAHRAKVEMLHVPYRGGSPALVDLIAGQVDFYIGGAASAMPLVKQGRLRALAVTGSERTSIAPGIPTVAETPGLEGFNVPIWYGVFVQARTPPEIVTRLADATAKVTADKAVAASLEAQGLQALVLREQAFAKLVAEERETWNRLITEAKLKLSE